jgi:DNA-binding response OmpR family regulator
LLVEDDPDLCNTLKRGLGKSGNVVDVTHDGEASMFYAQNPILNILDILIFL